MSQRTIFELIDLGKAHHHVGKVAEAEALYDQALAIDGKNVDALRLKGVARMHQGKPEEGFAYVEAALKLAPDNGMALCAMAELLRNARRLDEAEKHIRRGIEVMPDEGEFYRLLSLIQQERNELDAAISTLRKAVEIAPLAEAVYSRLLLLLHCHPDYDAHALYDEHRKWNEICAAPLKQFIKPRRADRNLHRKLRIGYISQDFIQQPLAFFILPLFRNHDRRMVDIIGYGEMQAPDKLTTVFQQLCTEWRFTHGATDEQLANKIIEDRIDIMVDLSVHSVPNRLLALARKPAPIQVTYLGYCSTTGLDTIDYRITDPYLDAPGTGDDVYSEKSWWLPETYWCYEPLNIPMKTPSPFKRNGFVTFGCLNNFIKVSQPALKLFCEIVKSVPNSHLVLHARLGPHIDQIIQQISSFGIDPSRLKFVGYLPLHEYLAVYGEIDIALDPFPYGGGTTTIDALLSGVPVVTQRGKSAVGRGGVGILSNVKHPELIAENQQQYQQIAVDLANDPQRMSHLRETLPQNLQSSPLMDAPKFARDIEAIYREMWKRYCLGR